MFTFSVLYVKILYKIKRFLERTKCMEDISFYEYVVAQKGSKVTVKKLFLTVFYVLYVVGALLLGAYVKLVLPLLAFIPLSLWIIVFLTWRYAKLEYEYSIASGELTLSNVYGGRSRRKVVSFKLKDCSLIAPLDDRYSDRADAYGAEKTFVALSNTDSPNAYFATFTLDGKRCILFFEATAHAIKVCKYYNSAATVSV